MPISASTTWQPPIRISTPFAGRSTPPWSARSSAAPPPLDDPALKAFVYDRLVPYKRPQRIFVLESMPASAAGKIQKHRRAALAEELCSKA